MRTGHVNKQPPDTVNSGSDPQGPLGDSLEHTSEVAYLRDFPQVVLSVLAFCLRTALRTLLPSLPS